jgi:hypothetical protein
MNRNQHNDCAAVSFVGYCSDCVASPKRRKFIRPGICLRYSVRMSKQFLYSKVFDRCARNCSRSADIYSRNSANHDSRKSPDIYPRNSANSHSRSADHDSRTTDSASTRLCIKIAEIQRFGSSKRAATFAPPS